MKKSMMFALMFAILPYSLALSTIINIPADYPAIQQGIDASSDGDTVLVQPGTYMENINFNGHNIMLGSLFITTNDTSYIAQTVIDGDTAGTVITLNSAESADAVICGLTIQNGYSQNGGGVYCADGSTPKLKNLRLRNNYAQFRGGGIYCENSSNALIDECVIDSNHTGNEYPNTNGGGGICCFNSNPIISGNLIRSNEAPTGGGIGCIEASPFISGNTVTQNTSFHVYPDCGGGGIACCNYSSPVIEYNHIYSNAALYGCGGGIYSLEQSDAVIEHNIIESNTASSNAGGGIAAVEISNISIIDNVIRYNYGGNGGGIAVFLGTHAIISGNIVAYNSAVEGGAGVYLSRSDPEFAYNVVYGNIGMYGSGGGLLGLFTDNTPLIHDNTICNNSAVTYACLYVNGWTGWSFYNNICRAEDSLAVGFYPSIQVTYCNIQDGYPGEGNIDCDPGFCDPDSDDYSLDIFSCCVGAGRDPLGNPDPTANIGALGVGCNLSGICDYVMGDVNWSGTFNGLDLVYSVSYFKGGPPPLFVCECTPGNIWYVCGDVNATCDYNGLDVTSMVNYLKGGSPLISCPDCPPVTE